MSKTYYEDLWERSWGSMQDIGPVHRHSTRILVDLVRSLEPRSVIDVGCGNGSNLGAIQAALPDVSLTGLDLSAAALAVARQRIRGEFFECNLENETFDRRADVVLSAQVIEHLEDDSGFLVKLRAMTERHCIVATMQGRMRKSERSIGHLRNYSRRGLEGMMAAAGFEIVRTIQWGFPFYSPLYRSCAELLGGHQEARSFSRVDRSVAAALYQLYRMNLSTKGDVLTVVGRAV